MEDELAGRFEEHRPRLLAVAYRMLGSPAEAEDAVQEAWLRLSRTDPAAVRNLGGWLTTVVARICLDLLRSRAARREDPLPTHLPQPVVSPGGGPDPADEALLADAVGLALLVVLDSLMPAERLAFVLHDMFAVPFGEIAAVLGGSPVAARQLASRARRRIRQAPAPPDPDRIRQRQAVEAFFAAARSGDFRALVATLHPDVVLRADGGPGAAVSRLVHGAADVAGQALVFARRASQVRPALVNGAAGAVVMAHGRAVAVMAFTVVDGSIVEIDILADPERLAAMDLPARLG